MHVTLSLHNISSSLHTTTITQKQLEPSTNCLVLHTNCGRFADYTLIIYIIMCIVYSLLTLKVFKSNQLKTAI